MGSKHGDDREKPCPGRCRLNGQWISTDSPTYRGSLAQQVKLPGIAGSDFWPVSPRVALLDAQARAARDAAALLEYRESE
jgi:hypothetical protein